jgi:large subunit ribosomal protein L24e
MVVKRACSFCAEEIEPGTGMMFVKRDGTVYHFCSSSCRKQLLVLGRVGHRLKWTRAHALKRAAQPGGAAAKLAPAARRAGRAGPAGPSMAAAPALAGPSGPMGAGSSVEEIEEPPVAAAPASEKTPKKPAARPRRTKPASTEATAPAAAEAPAQKAEEAPAEKTPTRRRKAK